MHEQFCCGFGGDDAQLERVMHRLGPLELSCLVWSVHSCPLHPLYPAQTHDRQLHNATSGMPVSQTVQMTLTVQISLQLCLSRTVMLGVSSQLAYDQLRP